MSPRSIQLLQLLCFLLDEVWRRGGLNAMEVWRYFFRPRKHFFYIGGQLCDSLRMSTFPRSWAAN